MRQISGALLLSLAFATAAAAQEGVRLRSGKFISGSVVIDENEKDGFRVERWDTGGTVFVRWTQVPDLEKARLLNRLPEAGAVAGVMVDGVRILTESRTLVGLLVKEDATQVLIKTSLGKTPTPVPKSALVSPIEKLKIPEAEAYSAEEMLDRRLEKAGDKDAPALMEAARFAISLRLFDRAKEVYASAVAADPARKEEVDALVAAMDQQIKEARAQDALAQVKLQAESKEFAKAIELAKKFLTDFPESEAARNNKDLVAQMEKYAQEFQSKKAEVLAREVPEAYKLKRQAAIGNYASAKYKVSEVRTKATNLDKEVVEALTLKFKSTAEEINAAWAKREQKPRTISYGPGSWIARGAPGGVMDTDAKTQPKQMQQQNNQGGNTINPFNNRQQQQQQQQQQKPKDLGKKLQTEDEWWQAASSSERKAFVEGEYARTSSAVTRVAETAKPCKDCAGNGTLSGNRQGYAVEIKCSRCHGSKDDMIIQYW